MAENDFLNYYLQRGFGSMTKKDVELWVFNCLLKDKLKNKRDFEISRYLKISESKVKTLRYESELVYGKDDDYKEMLKESFKNAKFREGIDGKIIMSIPNKILRLYLLDILEDVGRFYDSSFNTTIVSFSVDDFLYVINKLYADEDKDRKDLIEQKKTEIKNGKKGFPLSTQEKIINITKGIGFDLLKNIVGETLGREICNYLDKKNDKQ